jgi:hypothetical protein
MLPELAVMMEEEKGVLYSRKMHLFAHSILVYWVILSFLFHILICHYMYLE